MKRYRIVSSIFPFLIVVALACTEIHPIDVPGCVPPALDRNLVGTWHYRATYSQVDGAPATGSIRFVADGTVDDPDRLLGGNQQSSDGSVISKLYTVSNESVAIRLATKDRIVAIIFLDVDANTCDKITLRPAYDQSGNYIELTDKSN